MYLSFTCTYTLLLISSVDQTQMDFVEMLRVRDEKRRVRHVQSLRRQKVVEEDGVDSGGGGENGDLDEKQGSVKLSIKPASKPQPLRIVHRSVSSSSMSTNSTNRSVRIMLFFYYYFT